MGESLLATVQSYANRRLDKESFRKDLFNIARTTLSSKVLAQDKDYFANLAVDAVLRLKVSSQVSLTAILIFTGLDRLGAHSDHQKGRRQAHRLIPRRG